MAGRKIPIGILNRKPKVNYKALGKKGGQATAKLHGAEHFRTIGEKGRSLLGKGLGRGKGREVVSKNEHSE